MKKFLPLALLASITASLPAEDWSQWRGSNRSGVASESPPLIESLPDKGLQPLWMTDEKLSGGGGWSSPIVAGGKVILFAHTESRRPGVQLPAEKFPALSEDQRKQLSKIELDDYEANRHVEQRKRRLQQNVYHETLHCFDARSGSLLWTNRRESVYTNYRQSGTPAAIDGKLYCVGADRTLGAMDVESGDDLWTTPLPAPVSEEPICSSPAVADGVVVVLAGQLFGVDAIRGNLLWSGDPDRTGGLDASPVVWTHEGRELVIANVKQRDTVCLDPKTGRELWRVESHAGRSTPVVVDDRLITYGDSRKHGVRCFKLSIDGAQEAWSYQGINDPGSSPVALDGYVYVQGENRLVCLELSTGKPAWRTTLDIANPKYTSLIAADRKVFYAYDGLLCFAADAEGYQPMFQAKIDETGRLASAEHFRELYGIAELERAAGQEKALQAWKGKVDNHGPMECVSPAIVDGRLYLRLKSRIACYDLKQSAADATTARRQAASNQ